MTKRLGLVIGIGAVALGSAVAAQSASQAVPPHCTASDSSALHLILRGHYTLACGQGSAVVRLNGVAYRMNGSKCFDGGRLNFGRSGPASLPPTNGFYLVLDPPSTAGSVDVIDGGITLATSRGRLEAAISGTARVATGLKRGTFIIVGRSDSANGVRFTGSYYCGSNVTVSGSVGAVPPPPPPKFWSPGRCERVLLGVYGYASRVASAGFPLPDGKGHNFHVGQAICVGSGGPLACRWTTGHRSPLYSEFRVFTRSPLNGGVVRWFTLTTRAGRGLVPVAHHAGDQYVGWPPDFYMSSTRRLATAASPARFRFIVAPIAGRVTRVQNATVCTGG